MYSYCLEFLQMGDSNKFPQLRCKIREKKKLPQNLFALHLISGSQLDYIVFRQTLPTIQLQRQVYQVFSSHCHRSVYTLCLMYVVNFSARN